jgi:hypothetical protein
VHDPLRHVHASRPLADGGLAYWRAGLVHWCPRCRTGSIRPGAWWRDRVSVIPPAMVKQGFLEKVFGAGVITTSGALLAS